MFSATRVRRLAVATASGAAIAALVGLPLPEASAAPAPTLAVEGGRWLEPGQVVLISPQVRRYVFTVQLNRDGYQGAVTVHWDLVNGGSGLDPSAKAGQDFVAGSGVLTFPALGSNVRQVLVTPIDDSVDEPNEVFRLVLSNGSVPIHTSSAFGTIMDNDGKPKVNVLDTVADLHCKAGPIPVTVLLSKATRSLVTVHLSTLPATANPNFIPLSNTLVTFPVGSTKQTVNVMWKKHACGHAPKTVFVQATNPSNNATIADPLGLMTVTDMPIIG